MKHTLLMGFSVDKKSKKISIQREFDAPLKSIWLAWTESTWLDQWWAPKPYKAKTKSMDFREGGTWLYAMVGPDGTEQWSKAEYKFIKPFKSFSGLDAFCDEWGDINPDFPTSVWKVSFSEKRHSTIVNIEIQFKGLVDLEKYLETGFKEGLTAAMENLDVIFEK